MALLPILKVVTARSALLQFLTASGTDIGLIVDLLFEICAVAVVAPFGTALFRLAFGGAAHVFAAAAADLLGVVLDAHFCDRGSCKCIRKFVSLQILCGCFLLLRDLLMMMKMIAKRVEI